ncbi:hypothetical protein RUND412_008489 [Rhizina undulata]
MSGGEPVAHDIKVQEKEDSLINISKRLNLDTPLPPRPDFGTNGTKTLVRANYFPVTIPKGTLYKYDVSVTPEMKAKRMKKRLFQLLEEQNAFREVKKYLSTDFAKTLISTEQLAFTDGKLQVAITYYDEDMPGPPQTGAKVYNVTIQLVQEIELDALQRYVNGENRDYDPASAIQALNILLSKVPAKSPNIFPLGRNKFFVKQAAESEGRVYDLGKGLIALRGYYSSIRPSTTRVLCNVNVCMTAFYKAGALDQLMREFVDSNQVHPGYMFEKLKSFLKSVRIETQHIKDRKKNQPKRQFKSIIGLGRSANEEKFRCEEFENVEMSVATYFRRKYNIRLRNPDLPCVNIGTREKRILLPPELATVAEGQPYGDKLMDEQTSNMIRYACRPPRENAVSIVSEGMKHLGHTPRNVAFNDLRTSVSVDMIVVPARVLPSPTINYGNSSMQVTGAAWNLRGVKFALGVKMDNWAILTIQDDRPPNINPKEVEDNFSRMCRSCGMNVNNASALKTIKIPFSAREQGQISDYLRQPFQEFKQRGVKIILILLSNNDKAIYSAIKYCGDTKYGIGTVCTLIPKIGKLSPQYLANIALKFNLKLGGRNHILKPVDLGPLANGNTMIIGCDVTHPSPKSLKGTPSIAGVVASIDAYYTQYPASLRLQASRQEMIAELEDMVVERLKLWVSINRRYPESILVYRDGVSEGQFQIVLKEELPQIYKACERIQSNYRPKITVIIVGKRHHTRFYPTEQDKIDNMGNPAPGTVVDRGVTAVYDFDFYLQAHAGLQGTTRPAHYYVVHDQNKFNADTLQTLTHNLCYLFARATKSVSYCPPAYYADRVCERGRCYIYGLLNSDTASVKSGTSDEEAVKNYKQAQVTWGAGIHQELAQTMFYL